MFSPVFSINTTRCGHKMCKVGEGGVGDGCAQRWFGAANLIQKGSVHYALSQQPHSTCPVCRADCTVPRGDDGGDDGGDAGAGDGGGAASGGSFSGRGGAARTGMQYRPDPASRSGGGGGAHSSGASSGSSSYQRSPSHSSGTRRTRHRRHFYTDAGLGYDHGYDLRRERLFFMQRRYPTYISTTQVNDLSRDWMSGSRGALGSSSASASSVAWHSALLTTRRDAARAAAASRRSGSSSSSFGGGSSSGGGGSGGGW